MIIIARPIGETTLNGLEYILNDDGNLMKFKSILEAKSLLKANGFKNLTDSQLEDSFIFEEVNDEILKTDYAK